MRLIILIILHYLFKVNRKYINFTILYFFEQKATAKAVTFAVALIFRIVLAASLAARNVDSGAVDISGTL